MINQMLRGGSLIQSLTKQLRQSYVIRYTPKRSTFNKTTYNEEWLPRQKLYNKHRKPRLPGWDDPNTLYPKLIPPMFKPCKFRHYVRTVIEEEQKEKALRSKEYLLTDIRSGDIVDITFQQTFESDQTVTHRGLVLSFKRKNSWTAALEVAIRFGGMGVKCIYLVHSPKVKKIELVTKGSGCFKSSIKNGWHKFNKATLTSPKIRKRVMKNRLQGRRRKATAGKQTSAIKFDTIINDNVRRLV